MQAKFGGITFSDSDVVNPDDFIPAGESNPHWVRPYLFHDHGFVVGIAFADCEQDALDEIADSGKLDSFLVENEDEYPDFEGVSFLGNNGKPYDIEALSIETLPNPSFSFVALFNAANPVANPSD